MTDITPTALALAIRFHETYERLAPSFGYETRTDTRQFDPDSKNGRLMVAVCGELAGLVPTPSPAPEVEAIRQYDADMRDDWMAQEPADSEPKIEFDYWQACHQRRTLLRALAAQAAELAESIRQHHAAVRCHLMIEEQKVKKSKEAYEQRQRAEAAERERKSFLDGWCALVNAVDAAESTDAIDDALRLACRQINDILGTSHNADVLNDGIRCKLGRLQRQDAMRAAESPTPTPPAAPSETRPTQSSPAPLTDICRGCGNSIDREWCHCGAAVASHSPYTDGHSPVPAGCTCGYTQTAAPSELETCHACDGTGHQVIGATCAGGDISEVTRPCPACGPAAPSELARELQTEAAAMDAMAIDIVTARRVWTTHEIAAQLTHGASTMTQVLTRAAALTRRDLEPLTEVVTWVPVAERVPPVDGISSYVPVRLETGAVDVGMWDSETWFDSTDCEYECRVTHWTDLRGPSLSHLSAQPGREGT